MVAETPALGAGEDRPSAVNQFLTGKARPWLARWSGKVKTSTTVRSLPGVTAMLAWAVSVGGAVNYFADGLGAWAGLGVFAWFMTRLDSRIG